jgi:UDPglucose 6-dehydrogenase
MNNYQKQRFAENIISTLNNTLSDKKIAFLGWAFKKDTNDTRETAAMYVADYLLEEKARIFVYDPKVSKKQIYSDLEYLNSRFTQDNEQLLEICNEPYEACKDAHAIAILTEWDEFKDYNWERIYDNMAKPAFVFDGRNILDIAKLKRIGFDLFSIGK